MKWLKLLLSAAIALALFYSLNFRQNVSGVAIPPLGTFFNPFAGFWQNGTQADKIAAELELPGLQGKVTVVWDDRHVPHIFAENDKDLYYAQGYITARDRLWQMEFQTHAAAGRLSEIVGKSALEFDKIRRRIGMLYAAENSVQSMQSDDDARDVVASYAAGVNAYIESLDARSLPLEYKILDYAPEPWTPVKSALLLKYMSWTLTGRSTDRAMTRTLKALGKEVTDQLYPLYPPFQDPIVPPGTKWDFTPLPVKQPPVPEHPSAWNLPNLDEPNAWNGSNNWAVSGSKTNSGSAILCNDPHLELSLPSIWYEIQLVSPTQNVYGVSLPGSPAVTIGFNRNIAWGMTNAGSDVLDWYDIKFKDRSCREYMYGGKWRPTKMRIETIRVRGGEAYADTVYYTHHGPVVMVRDKPQANSMFVAGAAMRWTAHDPSREMKAFLGLNRATSYEDYLAALRHFDVPAQNIIFADVKGNIAIWHDGKFPLRWPEQGRYILDGSNPAHDWQGWVPKDQVPHVKNPARGFVSSANQNPADPTYPYYLGWNYASFTRGARINERLAAMQAITPQDMLDLQNDVKNLTARTILPTLLAHLQKQDLTADEQKLANMLKSWDYENKAMLAAPLVFEHWWTALYDLMWSDLIEREEGNLQWPRTDVTCDLIVNAQRANSTADFAPLQQKLAALPELVFKAFRQAKDSLEKRYGPVGKAWAWGKARGTDIRHLARIPGLGRIHLITSGSSGIVNATSRHHGPSWRMVVELGPEVKAWGIYPGGESGNPGSLYYDNMVDDWVAGRAYKLAFLSSPDQQHSKIAGKTVLRGGRK